MGSVFVTPTLLQSLLATLLDVFPHVEVLRPDPMSLIFIASGEPLDIVESGRRALELDAATFAAAGISRAEDIAATRALTAAGVREMAGKASLLTDDRNPLGLGLDRGLGWIPWPWRGVWRR
jgi:hypothetical protein